MEVCFDWVVKKMWDGLVCGSSVLLMVVAVLGGVRSGWYVGICGGSVLSSVLVVSVMLRVSYSSVMSFDIGYSWW